MGLDTHPPQKMSKYTCGWVLQIRLAQNLSDSQMAIDVISE